KEHGIEGPAASLVDRADKNLAVAAPRRVGAQGTQLLRKNVVNFVERGGAHLGHRFQLAQHRKNWLGMAQGQRCKFRKALDPFSPERMFWERTEHIDQRQSEVLQALELFDAALDMGTVRFIFSVE